MIHFLHEPKRHSHTSRSYLTQWFQQDILLITDVDINDEGDKLPALIEKHHCKNVLVDLSHNAMPESEIPEFLKDVPTLTTMFTHWYKTGESKKTYYFPLWAWMFSCRSNQFFQDVIFDAHGYKTDPMMCLNRNLHPHRIALRELLDPVASQIIYTMGKGLPGDKIDIGHNIPMIDIGVGHSVYNRCAVNIVTETTLDQPSLSEKSCKPFVARQIPIIVGPPKANQFLSDLGLDMFPDLIPWQTWDNELTSDTRLKLIAEFVIQWIQSGTVLLEYQRVRDRVEKNKTYFHSDQFREVILQQMPKVDIFKP